MKKILSFLLLFFLIFQSQVVAQEQKLIWPLSTNYTNTFDMSLSLFRERPTMVTKHTDEIQSFLNRGRSYECSIVQFTTKTPGGENQVHFFDLIVNAPNQTTVNAVATGFDYPALTNTDGPALATETQHAAKRISLVPDSTGMHIFNIKEKLNENFALNYNINCRETTLYGGYNRFFAQSAIVEIQNASAKSIPISISIIDAEGVTIVNSQAAVALADTRTDIIFANLPANNYGQIIITHTAPYGALSGFVAEYDSEVDGTIVLKRERPLTTTIKADASTP